MSFENVAGVPFAPRDIALTDDGKLAFCCNNCLAYVPIRETNGQGGQCQAGSPSVLAVPSKIVTSGGKDVHIQTVCPPVPALHWCLKFHPHPVFVQAVADKGLTQGGGVVLS